MRSTPTLKRGDVVRVRLEPVVGSEQGGERPAVVLSPEIINERSPVVLIAPMTSRKLDRIYPFEAVIEPPDGGITQRSKVLLLHTRAVDQSRIIGRYGAVSALTLDGIEAALRIATGLTRV